MVFARFTTVGGLDGAGLCIWGDTENLVVILELLASVPGCLIGLSHNYPSPELVSKTRVVQLR
jgi:hypothetical protein